MLMPSTLMEFMLRSPDSSNLAKASLREDREREMAGPGVSCHLALGMLRHEDSFKIQGSLDYVRN